MPTAEVSEAEWPLGGATMPHSFGFARRRTPSLNRAQVCRYRLGRGHYRTGVHMESEIGASTRSVKSPNHHFAQNTCASLGFAAMMCIQTGPNGPVALMRAPVTCPGAFVMPFQEQPDVEPQLRHTEHDPAGTVNAPQSMQGVMWVHTFLKNSTSSGLASEPRLMMAIGRCSGVIG